MYFYFFLQPEIFEEALSDGEDAAQNVASILNAILQNCFLAVFEDGHWEVDVKEKLEDWPRTMTRRRIKSILVKLKKHNRFTYNIRPDYEGVKSDLDSVFEQAASIGLDLILVVAPEENRHAPAGVEVASRRSYQDTAFEKTRSEIAVHGKTCNPGDMTETEFMAFHFSKALRYAETIHICDRFCGKYNFADNFRYTIKRFMEWLSEILFDPGNCRIVFHLGQPTGHGDQFILQELASFKNGPLSCATLEVLFYDEMVADPALPHQRFVLTNQIALDIDRGLDFLDRTTRKCRDTYMVLHSFAWVTLYVVANLSPVL